ncbi:hypothetical protein BJ165DRAFT_765312 [Panaeolus papilionaceus]|nr:hypothetical protein BJ165DRAFT_765312 [Panaeolus papilionaceus]
MQLCLINNDPTATLLVSREGIPMYSVQTANSGPGCFSLDDPSHVVYRAGADSARSKRTAMTTVKRLEQYNASRGHVETEIGVIEYRGPKEGTHLMICEQRSNKEFDIPPCIPPPSLLTEEEEEGKEEPVRDNSWEFTGVESKPFRWQFFAHCPVLMIADSSFTPLARYSRAKIGIVSRARKAFLEILPAGLGLIDFIVVTFVAFMKQRILIEGGPMAVYDHTLHSSPISVTPSVSVHSSPSCPSPSSLPKTPSPGGTP